MQFKDNEFDAIFIMGVLHHINDINSAIREGLRILKNQGGVICFIEPNNEGIKKAREIFPTHPDAVDPRDYFRDNSLDVLKVPMFDVFIYKN
ncbi:MAG: methyltransferase domain-containing protein [Promethearchaeota archaeon]